MGTREFHALQWLADVEQPAGIVVPASAWLTASRASGLKVAAVKRLRRRAPRGPVDSSRVRLADWLRRRGLTWRQVARACGYSEADNGHSARKAVRRYRQHLANGGTLPRARLAYKRRERGEPWGRIARKVGYAGARLARVMARRYAERAGEPWPVPLSDAPNAN